MPIDELTLEHDGLLDMGLLGDYIGSAYSPQVEVTETAGGHELAITYEDAETGLTTKTFDVLDGATGPAGPEGPAGFSPTATVTQTATGATVTITDQSGTTTADISNGAPGEQGDTGPQGPAGVSPTASVERVEGGAEVTVTDASGTTTAMLYDATIEEGSITDAMLAPDGIKQEHAWLWSNQITGELTGNPVTASDAHAAPMLALGVLGASEQDGTPTPDVPVEIQSVAEPVVTVAGKNLLPSNRFCFAPYNPAAGTAFNPSSTPGGTVTDNGDGTFTMTATANWQGAAFFTEVLSAGTYHLKFAFSGTNPRVSVAFVDADTMKFIGTSYNYTFSTTHNQTYTALDHRIIVVYVASSTAGTVTVTQPQLELGSTATAYEPYQGHTVTLPVTLRSLPDGTRDTVTFTYLRPSTREGWAWYSGEVTRNTGATTYQDGGFTGFGTSGGGKGFRRTKPSGTAYYGSRYKNIYSNILPQCTSETSDGCALWRDYVVFQDNFTNIAPSGLTDEGLAEFNEWNLTHPIDVVYRCVTTTETLAEIELPILPSEHVTLWATADATPTLNVEYVRDSNLVIASLEAAIADLATS